MYLKATSLIKREHIDPYWLPLQVLGSPSNLLIARIKNHKVRLERNVSKNANTISVRWLQTTVAVRLVLELDVIQVRPWHDYRRVSDSKAEAGQGGRAREDVTTLVNAVCRSSHLRPVSACDAVGKSEQR